ncbi:hypothetical protein ASE37_23625 [Rhizobium sp. Root268]|nr:hypothetical protein ASC86_23985 [Rhizobium sp. Root1212]KRD30286.1 hypothetical protein ASE37_23625 [Rhizobium sp. Root268]
MIPAQQVREISIATISPRKRIVINRSWVILGRQHLHIRCGMNRPADFTISLSKTFKIEQSVILP